MADEHQRLSRLLDGTPVAVELTTDGRLRLEVPLEHSFDAGRAAVKPALGKVLELMSTGLKQQRTSEVRIAAPSDPGGSSLLAADRAASTRDYLVARGVAPIRFVSVARGEQEGVEIVVSERFTPPPGR
jgi:outer membrane protein OmpA-like peptidoglycan-associated protein